MDYEAIKGNRMRTRSFHNENYNRRAFLRNYPLHWVEDEYSKEDTARVCGQQQSKERWIQKRRDNHSDGRRPEQSKETQEDFPICVLLGWKEDFVIQETQASARNLCYCMHP